jgi:putative FmdB family regulatory protein
VRYDFACLSCGNVWEIEKSIKDDGPKACPRCGKGSVERHFGADDVPPVIYANRPTWTYNDCKKYKECSHNGGPRTCIDPSKHGDLGAWNCPGKALPKGKHNGPRT